MQNQMVPELQQAKKALLGKIKTTGVRLRWRQSTPASGVSCVWGWEKGGELRASGVS